MHAHGLSFHFRSFVVRSLSDLEEMSSLFITLTMQGPPQYRLPQLTFPYCKRQKAEWSLGMRLLLCALLLNVNRGQTSAQSAAQYEAAQYETAHLG